MELKSSRTLTGRTVEQFSKHKDEYFKDLEKLDKQLMNLEQDFRTNQDSYTFKQIIEMKRMTTDSYKKYEVMAKECEKYLERQCTEESNIATLHLHAVVSKVKKMATEFIKVLEDRMSKLSELISVKSEARSRVTASSLSSQSMKSVIAAKKAQAEAARVEAEHAEKKASLIKERTATESKMEILNAKERAAKATAEVEVFEKLASDASEGSETREEILMLPNIDPLEKVASYVINSGQADNKERSDKQLSVNNVKPQSVLNPDANEFNPPKNLIEFNNEQVHEVNSTSALDISRFLLKKDLLLTRLTDIHDCAVSFRSWKASFKSVTMELKTSPSEEVDLLVKYLGSESKCHAISLRSLYISNPTLGCERIWNRLEERYGAPELVKRAVMTKLNRMNKISVKDTKALYELADVLSEVEALKQDPKYSVQLAYFDSSEGVLPIVQKLPLHLQEKWIARAAGFKKNNNDMFPPFSLFLEFVHDMAKTRNDPSLMCYAISVEKTTRFEAPTVKKTDINYPVSVNESKVKMQPRCPIHRASHSIVDCRSFQSKSVDDRKKIVKDNKLCFKCLRSSHKAAECRKKLKCSVCNSERHITLMHESRGNTGSGKQEGSQGNDSLQVPVAHGGERNEMSNQKPPNVENKRTQVCSKSSLVGRSCANIVLVDVFCNSSPSRRIRTYAILDDQSSHSLASAKLFDKLDLVGEPTEYTLKSCSGKKTARARKTFNCIVEAVDGSSQFHLPPLLECPEIPNVQDEIPTPDVASNFSHLQDISPLIPKLDEQADILLLIGRDLGTVHHVHEQIHGTGDSPFAQRLSLGWVIVGQVCLSKVHHADTVYCNKTYLSSDGRPSLFQPCTSKITVKETIWSDSSCPDLFVKTKSDDKVGLSVEDREFLKIMNEHMIKDPSGNLIAPLPFRCQRPKLPNNRSYALKRALLLQNSLQKDPKKQDHFVTFMGQIISRGHAEIAPPVAEHEECWYLPLFGVYHPKKPDQIRGVFDASAKFRDISLNDVLLQGPDLTNSLLGILLRFRREMLAISADIQQMFYSFLVDEKDRKFLRFFWYTDNDPSKALIEYRMRVLVFGNRPSPSVANFGLQKTAQISGADFGEDVQSFVSSDFYVDDGLTSLPTSAQAVDLMKRTQSALQQNGRLKLHKIASNKKDVLKALCQEDLAKDLGQLDLSKELLPVQRSLGLSWDLTMDCFTFLPPDLEKPFTRRGVLSVVNSLYDPLGFVAPVTIVGKTLLKAMTTDNCSWDEPIPEKFLAHWRDWTISLQSLQLLFIPRTYFKDSVSLSEHNELLVFSDASEKAVASVAYLIGRDSVSSSQIGFVIGKAKVAPSRGHTIPSLELCAAVLSVEIADYILEHLHVKLDKSKVLHGQ